MNPSRLTGPPMRLRLGGELAADGRARPHVRLRHHALRRHPPRPRGDLRLGRRRRARAALARAHGDGGPQRHRRRRRAVRRGPPPRRVAHHARDPAARGLRGDDGHAAGAPARPLAPSAAQHIGHVVQLARRPARPRRRLRAQRHRLRPHRRAVARRPASTARPRWRAPPSSTTTPTTPTRTTRSTSSSGRRATPDDEVSWPSPWGDGRPGLARRVRGDGARAVRPERRPALRRRRPRVPAPRLRGRAGRGGHRRRPVRARLAARRAWSRSTAPRWPSRRATWCSSRTCCKRPLAPAPSGCCASTGRGRSRGQFSAADARPTPRRRSSGSTPPPPRPGIGARCGRRAGRAARRPRRAARAGDRARGRRPGRAHAHRDARAVLTRRDTSPPPEQPAHRRRRRRATSRDQGPPPAPPKPEASPEVAEPRARPGREGGAPPAAPQARRAAGPTAATRGAISPAPSARRWGQRCAPGPRREPPERGGSRRGRGHLVVVRRNWRPDDGAGAPRRKG